MIFSFIYLLQSQIALSQTCMSFHLFEFKFQFLLGCVFFFANFIIVNFLKFFIQAFLKQL